MFFSFLYFLFWHNKLLEPHICFDYYTAVIISPPRQGFIEALLTIYQLIKLTSSQIVYFASCWSHTSGFPSTMWCSFYIILFSCFLICTDSKRMCVVDIVYCLINLEWKQIFILVIRWKHIYYNLDLFALKPPNNCISGPTYSGVRTCLLSS